MDVLISCEYGAQALEGFPCRELALFVMDAEQVPESAEVSVSFVDDDAMARLNSDYRGKSGPTDVLSFECDGLDDGFDCASASDAASFGVPFELGDVVIAPDVAAAQAADFGHSVEAELSFLLVHGLLHLCGYDHVEDGDAELMEARERELLEGWADAGHECVRGIRDDTIRGRH